jgi:hypothetical protein
VSWAAVRPAQVETNDVLSRLEQMAQEDLTLGGSLTGQEERDAQQSARGAFAARGMAMGNPAVAAEVLNRDAYSRQRLGERRAFAGGVSEMLQREDLAQADLDQQAALENSRGQMQVELQNVQDMMRVAQANQDDARVRELSNQEERIRRDLGAADAQLRQQQLALQRQELQLSRERAADSSQQWRSELDSRESMAGDELGLRRDLAQQDLLGQREERAAGIAASNNDFMMNRGEARRIDASNWDRWGQLNGGGGVSRFRAIGSGVSRPRVNTGFGFVSR